MICAHPKFLCKHNLYSAKSSSASVRHTKAVWQTWWLFPKSNACCTNTAFFTYIVFWNFYEVGVFEYCVSVIFLILLLESFTSPVIFSFHAYHSRFVCHGLHCVVWHCFEPLNQWYVDVSVKVCSWTLLTYFSKLCLLGGAGSAQSV